MCTIYIVHCSQPSSNHSSRPHLVGHVLGLGENFVLARHHWSAGLPSTTTAPMTSSNKLSQPEVAQGKILSCQMSSWAKEENGPWTRLIWKKWKIYNQYVVLKFCTYLFCKIILWRLLKLPNLHNTVSRPESASSVHLTINLFCQHFHIGSYLWTSPYWNSSEGHLKKPAQGEKDRK